MPFTNPVLALQGVDHGDPFVLEHRGTYHLFHTGRDGVRAHTSTDLVTWTDAGVVLVPDQAAAWARRDFWAPEVRYADGCFWMYVAATTTLPDGAADDGARRLGVARAATPLGPYQLSAEPLVRVWSIDGHPYLDEDGRAWLFYNVRDERTRVGEVTGCGNVVDELLAPDRLAGAPAEVTFPSERWEANEDGTWYWNEGAWVLRRRGVLHQMYSGGCYADHTYAVGTATAPAPRGPWTKDAANPHLTGGRRIRGVGHHSVVLAPDGVSRYACYHGRLDGRAGRVACLDRLRWAGDRPQIGDGPGPATTPGEDARPLPPPRAWTALRGDAWHVSGWTDRGEAVIGGRRIRLGAAGVHRRLEVRRQGSEVRAWVDGLESPSDDAAGAPDTPLEAPARTAVVEDDRLHRLVGGEAVTWDWAEEGPVEVAVAVRGPATLRAGGATVTWRGGDRFALLTLRAEGADRVEVRAGRDGATVTDLLVTRAATG